MTNRTDHIPWGQLLPAFTVVFMAELAHGGLLLALLPSYGHSALGMSKAAVGLCISLYFAAELSLKVPSGATADRLGQKALLVVALCASVATLAVMPLVRHPPMLMFLAALHGASASPIWPCVLSFAADRAGPDNRGTVMGGVFAAWLAGAGTGLVISALIGHVSLLWRFGALGCAFCAALAVALLFLPQSPIRHSAPLRRPLLSAFEATLQAARELVGKPLLLSGLFLQTFSIGLLLPVFEGYCSSVHGLKGWQISTLVFGGGGVALALVVPMGRLADLLDRRWLMVLSLSVCALVVALFPLAGSFPQLVGLIGCLGASYAVALPTWNATLVSHAPSGKRALLLSAFMVVEQVGVAIAPTIAGILWDRAGPMTPFFASGCVLGVMSLIWTFAPGVFVKSDECRVMSDKR